jgi:hypothetical protein
MLPAARRTDFKASCSDTSYTSAEIHCLVKIDRLRPMM